MDRDDDIKKLETLPRANLEALQLDAFRGLLGQQGENAFYSARLAEGIQSPASIRSLEDFRQLPFTTKEEICADQAEHPPYGSNLGLPPGEYKRHIGAAAALAGLGRKLVVDAALLALYLCRCGVAT